MKTFLRFTNAVFLCSLIVELGLVSCAAQRANCKTKFYFTGSSELNLPSLLRIFSQEQETSLVAEIFDESKNISVLPGTYSLDELTAKFNPDLSCEAVEGVLHVFDREVLSLSGNALNYRFAFFKIPPNVDKFRIAIIERLVREPFVSPQSGNSLIQSLGGGMAGNADTHPLEETIHRNVQARDLIFSVANKYVLSSVICFPKPKPQSTDLDVWKFAAAHWYWTVNDKQNVPQ